MKRLVFVVLVGCTSYSAVPLAVHPTATASEQSVGVAVGGSYGKQSGDGGDSVLTVPHGEGWLRFPVAPGQVGVHVAPDIVSAGFRYDVAAGSLVLGIEPRVGGAYTRIVQEPTDPLDDAEKESRLTLAAGLIATLIIPAGAGFAYVTPKLGFENVRNLTAGPMEDESANLYVLGMSVGVELGAGLSLELAIHRIDDAEEEEMGMRDAEPIWLVVPTLGYRR